MSLIKSGTAEASLAFKAMDTSAFGGTDLPLMALVPFAPLVVVILET